jgi:hypothetical protein
MIFLPQYELKERTTPPLFETAGSWSRAVRGAIAQSERGAIAQSERNAHRAEETVERTRHAS